MKHLVIVIFISALSFFNQFYNVNGFAFPKTEELGFHKTCPTGYELHVDKATNKLECRCKKYHLYWPDDGLCYREFQQGPCPEGHR